MRVIGGRLKGRDLGSVPNGVRPTTDRVRESLFSILGSVEGCRVLDLYAGSGALGIEAYSRGAESVVFVEGSRKTAFALSKRLERLGMGEDKVLRVVAQKAEKALQRLGRAAETAPDKFDLVLMDPPYADDNRTQVLIELFSGPLLEDEAIVVVESPTRSTLPPISGARVRDSRRYGETTLTWFERKHSGPPGVDRGHITQQKE